MSLANNKKAFHDFFIYDKYEAGIELKGTEVKSAKYGKISIQESYVKIIKNEVYILNMYISNYVHGSIYNQDERRTRKLLLHRQEIKKLIGKVTQSGFTIVPLSVYLKKGLIKIEIALAKGKKEYDKREELAKKASDRDIERMFKDSKKGI